MDHWQKREGYTCPRIVQIIQGCGLPRDCCIKFHKNPCPLSFFKQFVVNMPTNVIQQQILIPPEQKQVRFCKYLLDTVHEFGI
jgi:hypothetical protein